ncbi:MAG: hypothetical protein ACQEVA_03000 [Myxococcota bacterium]
MRGERLRHLALWAVLLTLGMGLSSSASALETPADGHEWVVEGGVPELSFARIWGDPEARGWVQFGQDFALLGPTVGAGYETTSFPEGVHDLRLSAEAELWTAFRDVSSIGLRSSLRLDNVWRAGWVRLLAGPRLDGAVALAGLEDAYLAPGGSLAVGVELPSGSGDALGIWLNTSVGYAFGGFGGGALRGRFWLGVGF